jgi:hypothetical protein
VAFQVNTQKFKNAEVICANLCHRLIDDIARIVKGLCIKASGGIGRRVKRCRPSNTLEAAVLSQDSIAVGASNQETVRAGGILMGNRFGTAF